jgi:hypothetical protein
MATLAMPMSAVPASIQDLPIPIEDLQAQVNELSAQKQEVPAAIQESSATVQDVHKLTEEKSNSNRATTTPTEETTSSAEETPTLTAEKIDLAEGNTVSTDDTLAQVQEIPIAVQVPAKHDVETATAALDTSLDSLPPPKVAVPAIKPPSSYFKPNHHPRMQDVSQEVDGYFLEHWPFKDEKARKKFVGAGFSRVTCLYFPEALDDRIHFACRLLTVLFLVDGKHEATLITLLPLINHHRSP